MRQSPSPACHARATAARAQVARARAGDSGLTSGDDDEAYEESERAGGGDAAGALARGAAGPPVAHGTPPGAAGGGGAPALATPAPKQRGRKRRTEPILVEREDGTKEEVSPQVYRRLRRRVTNRLSARRMRQKRAEEREAIAAEARAGGPGRAVRCRGGRALKRDARNWRGEYGGAAS
jgi:hypothetical protein